MENIIDDRYKMGKKIKSRKYSHIYTGKDLQDNRTVLIKLENYNQPERTYEREHEFYKTQPEIGCIPKLYFSGEKGEYAVLVMEILSGSLEEAFRFCQGRFTMQSISLLAIQLIKVLRKLHDHGYVYRNITGEHFLMGFESDHQFLYLVDFGLVKRYNPDLPVEQELNDKWMEPAGPLLYCSLNAQQNKTQSRRDDLEAIGYMLVRYACGQLPWEHFCKSGGQQNYQQITELKKTISLEDLCAGLPSQLCEYLRYVRSLELNATPNYAELIKIFWRMHKSVVPNPHSFLFDWDWLTLRIQRKRTVRRGKGFIGLPTQRKSRLEAIPEEEDVESEQQLQ